MAREETVGATVLPAAAQPRFDDPSGRAMLVDQGGVLIFASYGQGIAPTDRLNSFSLVKSLVGALVIRSLADGRITSLDDPLALYLGPDAPEVSIADTASPFLIGLWVFCFAIVHSPVGNTMAWVMQIRHLPNRDRRKAMSPLSSSHHPMGHVF